MIILDLLKFFARIPSRDGVRDNFVNGSSSFEGYQELIDYVNHLPNPLIPEIESYVFGSSMEAVKARVTKVTGTFLFVDFGEFESSRDRRNSISDRQRLAVTIGRKKPSSSDCVEEVLASDQCLELANKVRAFLLAESEKHTWLQLMTDKHQIIPFESKELQSVGWTLMFDIVGDDWFDVKVLSSSFR